MDDVLSFVVLTAAVAIIGGMVARGVVQRRGYRDFAAAHGMRFVGTVPSDKREPYVLFERVRRSVLLLNVVEGTWDGYQVAVFEHPVRRGAWWTATIVTASTLATRVRVVPSRMAMAELHVAGDERRGWERVALTEPALASQVFVTSERGDAAARMFGRRVTSLLTSAPPVLVEATVGCVWINAMRRIPPAELLDFVRFSVSLASAMETDSRE